MFCSTESEKTVGSVGKGIRTWGQPSDQPPNSTKSCCCSVPSGWCFKTGRGHLPPAVPWTTGPPKYCYSHIQDVFLHFCASKYQFLSCFCLFVLAWHHSIPVLGWTPLILNSSCTVTPSGAVAFCISEQALLWNPRVLQFFIPAFTIVIYPCVFSNFRFLYFNQLTYFKRFIYWSGRQSFRETQRGLPSTASLPEWLQWSV